jgi:hypothetical protein
VPVNGDPLDEDVLDNFAFEVHARFQSDRSRVFNGEDGKASGALETGAVCHAAAALESAQG